MALCKTVKVKNAKSKSGFAIISETDFKDGDYVLYKEPRKRTPSAES